MMAKQIRLNPKVSAKGPSRVTSIMHAVIAVTFNARVMNMTGRYIINVGMNNTDAYMTSAKITKACIVISEPRGALHKNAHDPRLQVSVTEFAMQVSCLDIYPHSILGMSRR